MVRYPPLRLRGGDFLRTNVLELSAADSGTAEAPVVWDVVGPVCESGDWIGRDRALHVRPGHHLAVLSAGAYCMSMASNYNSRGRAAEVLVDGTTVHLMRRRETAIDQMQGETLVA